MLPCSCGIWCGKTNEMAGGRPRPYGHLTSTTPPPASTSPSRIVSTACAPSCASTSVPGTKHEPLLLLLDDDDFFLLLLSSLKLLPVFPLHVLLADVKLEDLRDEELFSADVVWKMLQNIQSLVHTRTLPPHFPWQGGLEEHEADPEEDLDPLAEEHVSDAEDRGPGQGPREHAEEALGHVEDWLHPLPLPSTLNKDHFFLLTSLNFVFHASF